VVSEQPFRWPHDLGFRDLLALVVVGPVLGWWLMVGRVGFPGNGWWDQRAIRAGLVDGRSLAGLLGGLAVIAVIVGLISPRLKGFAATTVMVPVLLFVIYDFAAYDQGNVIGAVVVLYVMFTWFAVFVSWASTDILRFVRDRRRAARHP
jgi:hypothetical protein